MYKNRTVAAIILAAGNSTRFKDETFNSNKNLFELNGKEVISYSIDKFNNNTFIDKIIIVISKNEYHLFKKYQNEKTSIIFGGDTRQESVFNAIQNINTDLVLIHDGARPFITQDFINNLLLSSDSYLGATIGVKSKDTIKIANLNDTVQSTTDRKNTWIIQTPQCFCTKTLLTAHIRSEDTLSTDDCGLLEKMNLEIKIIPGDYKNIKITTPEDAFIMEYFLKTRTKTNKNQYN